MDYVPIYQFQKKNYPPKEISENKTPQLGLGIFRKENPPFWVGGDFSMSVEKKHIVQWDIKSQFSVYKTTIHELTDKCFENKKPSSDGVSKSHL